jgi:hypothetical protein
MRTYIKAAKRALLFDLFLENIVMIQKKLAPILMPIWYQKLKICIDSDAQH